jgi:dipeptide/tripeptide permease
MIEDFGQFKSDIGELRANVSFIKDEMHDMKYSITNSIEKISNSMTLLATVTEKLNQNFDEHKIIHLRIDKVIEEFNENYDGLNLIKDELNFVKNNQISCLEKNKTKEEKEKNSILNKTKEKIIEYILIVGISVLFFVLFSHLSEYITFMNNNNINNINPIK